jgi:hypothetical protein
VQELWVLLVLVHQVMMVVVNPLLAEKEVILFLIQ